MATNPDPCVIEITRVYDAPVAAVWDAWTDPAQVAQWWGPRGFTLTTHSRDFKVGGIWHYTMHGPDGTDYPNKTVYLEIEKHAKLVYDHGGYDDRPPLFRVTVQFADVDGKTRMAMGMRLATPEAARQTREFIKAAGGNATWDRLAEYLVQHASGKQKFFINRSFDAPRQRVFDAWVDPEQLRQWLPPTGFTMQFSKSQIAAGHTTLFSMTNGAVEFHVRAEYAEIDAPRKLVYRQQFCDADGKLSRHPGAPIWPDTLLMTVLFTEEAERRTRVTLICEPESGTTAQQIEAFVKERGGMTAGWTGSFDKLEAMLS